MANFHIAFDNANATLGHYFEQSKEDIVDFITKHCTAPRIILIPSGQCNQAYIDMTIPTINSQNFLFLAYSHGENDYLTANGTFYIHSNHNANLFVRSFFYSMACSTAQKLGQDIINGNAHAFIGYSDVAYALQGAFQKLSIECDNSGIKTFILGSSLGDVFQAMKDYFTQQIDSLESNGDILVASYLRRNRDALHYYGSSSLLFQVF
jgi:hypothetical protein